MVVDHIMALLLKSPFTPLPSSSLTMSSQSTISSSHLVFLFSVPRSLVPSMTPFTPLLPSRLGGVPITHTDTTTNTPTGQSHEPSTTTYNEQLWRRSRNEKIISEMQTQAEIAG